MREWHIRSLKVTVVLNLASPHRILDTSDLTLAPGFRSAWVAGLHSHHRLTEAVGLQDFYRHPFHTIGAHLFLKAPMSLLADRNVDLEDIDQPFTQQFENRVYAARGWDACLDLIECLVAERLTKARPPFAGTHALLAETA